MSAAARRGQGERPTYGTKWTPDGSEQGGGTPRPLGAGRPPRESGFGQRKAGGADADVVRGKPLTPVDSGGPARPRRVPATETGGEHHDVVLRPTGVEADQDVIEQFADARPRGQPQPGRPRE
ncbi:hypothetical protein ACIP79_36200 [Streptomyces sp. NPDC088747]|uniref:hypothetical protein n=1 Tax=Streptomyces sp. NPDC088747 TaxID=3365886 RepID=UPI00382430B2